MTSHSLMIFPDSHLATIASDSCIVFNSRAGLQEEAMSMIRAKEQVQDTLAVAAWRLVLYAEAVAAVKSRADAPAGDADASDSLPHTCTSEVGVPLAWSGYYLGGGRDDWRLCARRIPTGKLTSQMF
jgi:hypothetical protein